MFPRRSGRSSTRLMAGMADRVPVCPSGWAMADVGAVHMRSSLSPEQKNTPDPGALPESGVYFMSATGNSLELSPRNSSRFLVWPDFLFSRHAGGFRGTASENALQAVPEKALQLIRGYLTQNALAGPLREHQSDGASPPLLIRDRAPGQFFRRQGAGIGQIAARQQFLQDHLRLRGRNASVDTGPCNHGHVYGDCAAVGQREVALLLHIMTGRMSEVQHLTGSLCRAG